MTKDLKDLALLSSKVRAFIAKNEQWNRLLESATVPDDLLDPIMQTIMMDPVRLPS
jgi:hypothetical protein